MGNNGQQQRFEQLFREQYSRLFYYALQITHDREASRDIVSETFSRVWSQWETVDADKAPTLLLVSVKRRCVDHLRHLKVLNRYSDYYLHAVDECYIDDHEAEQRQQSVDMLMAQLEEPTKTILTLCFLEHRKYDEVAEQLHIHHDTVKRHVMKALKLLRGKFAPKNVYPPATETVS